MGFSEAYLEPSLISTAGLLCENNSIFLTNGLSMGKWGFYSPTPLFILATTSKGVCQMMVYQMVCQMMVTCLTSSSDNYMSQPCLVEYN